MKSSFHKSFLALTAASLFFAQMTPAARAAEQHGMMPNTQPSPRFQTAEAMQLANEEILIFSCGLPYKSLGSTINSDAYWYSLYNLGSLVMNSGMGVHMVNAPVGRQMAKMHADKFPQPQDFMMHKMKQFMMRTGLKQMPKNPHPVYLPFAAGNPQFTHSPNPFDFGTMRWDPAQFDQTLTPGAIGQTVTKQILWSEDFFSSHRGSLLGKDAFDGFRGGVLTALALNSLMTFKDELAFDGQRLGAVNPMTYEPQQGLRYFAHAVKPRLKQMMPGMPAMLSGFELVDKSSHLYDQASLLWASSEFYYYSDPTVKDSYDAIFGDESKGALFPQDPHMLSKGISAVILKNLMAMHQHPQHKVMVSRAEPGKKGQHVDTAELGMLAVALENTVRAFHNEPMIKKMAQNFLKQQADFIIKHLQQPDGSFANGYDLQGNKAALDNASLAAQANAIRVLALAYKTTQDNAYLSAASKGYQALKQQFWSDSTKLFKAQRNDRQHTTLTPGVVAATLGALRELALASDRLQADAVKHMTLFFNHTIKREDGQGLQLAEMGQTGEMIPEDEVEMAKMTLQMKKMMQMPQDKRMQMMMEMRDADEDGVPNPMFAGGMHGTAPVVRHSVTLKLQ
ncbi:MAG: hypothetical protein IGS03_12805 [Candidatus Sericytochromatia bacterium]|nr:hypothetical protein [Candidatus Sericytochromatia bacterium]